MTPSVYVIQKSSGMLYCVTKEHYEEYKHWYDLVEPKESVPEPVDVETVASAKPKRTRGK